MFLLEAEPKLCVDAAIVSRIAAAKSTEAARSRGRLPKQQGSKVTNRIAEVHVVQDVVEVQRERQVVTACAATRPTETTTTAARSTKTAARATGTACSTATWTTTSHATTHHRGVAAIALLITLLILLSIPRV